MSRGPIEALNSSYYSASVCLFPRLMSRGPIEAACQRDRGRRFWLRTALFEDGLVRPRGGNYALTRTRDLARDSETFGPNGPPFAEGRLVAPCATAKERDAGTAERA